MFYHTFFYPLGGLLWVVLIVLLIANLWRGKECHRHNSPHHHLGHAAEDILAERFARGEITEAEYNERLAVLKRNYK